MGMKFKNNIGIQIFNIMFQIYHIWYIFLATEGQRALKYQSVRGAQLNICVTVLTKTLVI